MNFHALIYPAKHVTHEIPTMGLADDAKLLHRDLDPLIKLQYMHTCFMPVVAAIFPNAVPGEPYTLRKRLVDYCQEQIHPEDEAILSDLSGRPMSADEILPDQDLLWTMYTTWRDGENARCRPLQRYIAQVVSEYEVSRQPHAS